jgi:hypothetical protein
MAIKIKLRFLYDENGNKTRVLLSTKDFEHLMEELADLKSIYKAQAKTKNKKIKLIPFEKVKKDLGIH